VAENSMAATKKAAASGEIRKISAWRQKSKKRRRINKISVNRKAAQTWHGEKQWQREISES